MAGKFAKLRFIIGAETATLKRDLKKADGMMGKFKMSVKSLGGIMAAAFAVAGIAKFASASVKAADIQLKAEASLLTALGGREDAQQRIITQAQELQKLTLFGDEETIQAASFLAQMGLAEDQISKLLPLVQDFATAQKMQLGDAAKLVAKSVGSSTNALSRYGIVIEGAVGSTERTESAVNALSTAFKDQARVAAETGTGPLVQLQNAWGDIKEQIGGALIPVLARVAKWLADKLPKVFNFFRGVINRSRVTVKGFILSFQSLLQYGRAAGYALAHPLQWKEIGNRFREAKSNVSALRAEYAAWVNEIYNPTQSSGSAGVDLSVGSGAPAGGKSTGGGKGKTPFEPIIESVDDLVKAEEDLIMVTSDLSGELEEAAFIGKTYAEAMSEIAVETKRAQEAQNAFTAASMAAYSSQEEGFAALGKTIWNVTRDILFANLAQGISNVVVSALKSVPFPFNIAAAAAAGGATAALFNAVVPKMATGGIIPQGFSGDTYPALLSSGETVIPKPKALGSGGGMELYGYLSGETIRLTNQRSQYRNRRVTGH